MSDTEKPVEKPEEEKVKAPPVYKCCDNPQITYYGVTNLNINERTIGSVDVWRCGVCKKQFCEEKQLGIEELTDVVGMPKIDSDAKWAVCVSKLQKGRDRWKLVKLKENDLSRPCKYLEDKLKQNNLVKEFLHKGGLRYEILSSGKIIVGDIIK